MDALARPVRGLPLEAAGSCVSLSTLRHARRQPVEIKPEALFYWSSLEAAASIENSGKVHTEKEFLAFTNIRVKMSSVVYKRSTKAKCS